jgi:hypothetical protein
MGLFVSQSVEQQSTASLADSSQFSFATRVSGSVDLLKFWHRSITTLDYVGGGIFYGVNSIQSIQQLNLSHRFLGRRRQLTLAGSLSSYPTGNFGFSSFGGAGLYDLVFAGTGAGMQAGPGLADFLGANSLAGVGQASHLNSVVLGEFTQILTARSLLTVAGGYGITHYFGESDNLINNSQFSALARYSYQLSSRSEVGAIYGYRAFQFPLASDGQVQTQLVQGMYQRQLSRRMSFAAGAGPEFTRLRRRYELQDGPIQVKFYATTNQINVSAFALLNYRLRRSGLTLSYNRLVTSGSGLAAGANTDVVRFFAGLPISHLWQSSFNAGYVRQSFIGQNAFGTTQPPYQNGYVGVGVRRAFGRHLNFVASYQLNTSSSNGFCVQLNGCGNTVRRQSFLVGLSMGLRPIRLEP